MSKFLCARVLRFVSGSFSISRVAGIPAVVVLACFMAFGSTLPAGAQLAGKGSITGTVSDPTGAVVPGATVTATNNATGISTSQTSSSAGDFSMSTLDPGIYTITVKAPGF